MTGPTEDQADVAIIIVSTNEAKWLEPCLSTVFAHAGDAKLDVVVVDNESTDGTRELVESQFPAGARGRLRRTRASPTPTTAARMTCTARYVLFLNPDTEIVDGTFGELAAALDARPDVGMAGVKQLTGDGTLWPTIRYFPSVRRALGEAFGSERWTRAVAVGRRARARPLRLRGRGRVRLDLGVVHVLPARGAAERRPARRALLHLLRGARPLPAHEARGLDAPATCRR